MKTPDDADNEEEFEWNASGDAGYGSYDGSSSEDSSSDEDISDEDTTTRRTARRHTNRSHTKQCPLTKDELNSLISEGQSLAGNKSMKKFTKKSQENEDKKFKTKLDTIRTFSTRHGRAPRCYNKVNNTGMSEVDKKAEIQNYNFVQDMCKRTRAAFHSKTEGLFIPGRSTPVSMKTMKRWKMQSFFISLESDAVKELFYPEGICP